MLLAELVATSAEVAGTRSRLAKVAALAGTLGRSAPEEVEIVAAYLSGSLRQRRTGVGWRSAWATVEPAAEPSLTVVDVDAAFEAMAGLSGPGSQTARRAQLDDLMGRTTHLEQRWLAGLITGETRQGALDGVMVDALIRASGLPAADVRRAVMLAGDVGAVAHAALFGGAEAVAGIGLVVGRAVRPMLAASAKTVADAMGVLGGEVAVEAKLDGIRVQAHRDGDDIRLFTRSLDDITARLPEVVEAVAALPVHRAILDGEALALAADGRPRPFQETAARSMSVDDRGRPRMTPFFFDVLAVDDEELLDLPFHERAARLAGIVPEEFRVARAVTDDVAAAEAFTERVLADGHEGVVLKDLAAPYEAGRRGSSWVKVKPVHTLDLVVLAVEWGSGRRRGWLSNIHLGARDPATGGFVMLGKTFKGMTDEMLAWQTARFLELETHRDDWTVYLRPEQVVEIAFDGLQRSTRYPGGVALRFARVLRYRDDKSAADADTIGAVQALRGD
ncbi:MAG: ATP-dependent DNA ligase [Tessaracoccus sp.]|uniref:ATP-dependent DNA ligase n=1 Tax=Tessaracoccus sp. TaxID=1971211 RepID=UPI001EB55544|nr:ATP-dependent DNA ligase [Tessaracoccus sp.]MBK7820678.1 ATP-dependent DNA ligase [Tessaracoccus sp.]